MQTKTFSYTFSNESVVKITVKHYSDVWGQFTVNFIRDVEYEYKEELDYKMLYEAVTKSIPYSSLGDWTNITKL
jgi:hypothetical protein